MINEMSKETEEDVNRLWKYHQDEEVREDDENE